MSDLALARAGDDAAFTRLVEPLRRELHAHCYRMLGSSHDADDALQDALVRAWRGIGRFAGLGSVRSWLYTIATRTCLDLLEARGRRALPMDLSPDMAPAEVAWLGPYPDAGLSAEQRESVELAFVAALQHLPGNQRAALLLFEVLGFSAAEIATIMDTSAASVNSALQRARATVQDKILPGTSRPALRKAGDARLRAVVAQFAGALDRGDADGLVALLTKDVTWSMPPLPEWYAGLDAVMEFAVRTPLSSCGSWQHVPVWANGRPAVAGYLNGDFWSVTVFDFAEDRIARITSFLGSGHAATFGLPLSL